MRRARLCPPARCPRSSRDSTRAACRWANWFSPVKRAPLLKCRTPRLTWCVRSLQRSLAFQLRLLLAAARAAALNLVRPLFATLPGVSAPPPFGGSARTIVVNIDPDRLNSNKISTNEVVEAITQANLISPSGNMMMDGKYPMVPLNSIPRNVKDLEAVPIHPGVYRSEEHTSELQSRFGISYAV